MIKYIFLLLKIDWKSRQNQFRLDRLALIAYVLKLFIIVGIVLSFIYFKPIILESLKISTLSYISISNFEFISIIGLVGGSACGFYRFKLTGFLRELPFKKFIGPLRLMALGLIYSSISLELVVIYIFFMYVVGYTGLLLSLIFYICYYCSFKNNKTVLINLFSAFLFLMLGNHIIIFANLSIILFLDYLLNIKREVKDRSFSKSYRINTLLMKEYSFFKVYSSERYYLFVQFLLSILLIGSLFFYPKEYLGIVDFGFNIWICIAFIFFPVSLFFFNALGMDINVVPRFLQAPQNFAKILYTKNRIYTIILYVLIILFLLIFIPISRFGEKIIHVLLGLIIFVEANLIFSFIFSILFSEKKERKWKYGQYFLSKNFNLVPFVIFLLIIFNHYLVTYELIGWLIIFSGFLLSMNIIYGKYFIENLLEFKFKN